jgi:hypothetical protein
MGLAMMMTAAVAVPYLSCLKLPVQVSVQWQLLSSVCLTRKMPAAAAVLHPICLTRLPLPLQLHRQPQGGMQLAWVSAGAAAASRLVWRPVVQVQSAVPLAARVPTACLSCLVMTSAPQATMILRVGMIMMMAAAVCQG